MNRKLAAGLEQFIPIAAVGFTLFWVAYVGLMIVKGTLQMAALLLIIAVFSLAVMATNQRDLLGI
jgi:4-hydroxybenzoate polyprenyltransferase